MLRRPSRCELEPMPLPAWSIYKLAAKRQWLGIVEAPDAKAAIEAGPRSSRRMRGGCLRCGNGREKG
jgi:hypothetical protein